MTPPRRATGPLVLAMDIGSSSMRAAIHDQAGRTVPNTTVQVPYSWDVQSDRSVRLPVQTLIDLAGQALDQVVELAGPMAPDIAAGGISCFFHSVAGLDGTGRPLTPILSWADSTSAADAAALRRELDPARTHQVTGVPIHASYWPARIRRLGTEEPGIRRWAGLPGLLAQAWIGRTAASLSMASGTGLLDRARGTWSAELLDELGVEPEALPALVADDQPIGRMTGAAARRWPQLAHVTWFPAWGDGSCSNVGLGATAPGTAALMVGTSGALRTFLPDAAPPVPDGLFAYRLGAGTVMGGQLSEGGGMLAWTARLLGRSPGALERAASASGADDHGLTVLPYALGERSLRYHDDAQGVVAGLQAGTQPAQVYRAVVESIAFGFAAVDDRLAEVLGARPAVLASGGALDRSPMLAQALADALGRDIRLAAKYEGSRHGAALLALRGLGLLGDRHGAPAPRTRVVRFDAGRSARYRAARARQDALYQAVLG